MRQFDQYFLLNEDSKNREFSSQEEIDEYIKNKIDEVLGGRDDSEDKGVYIVAPVGRGKAAIIDLLHGRAVIGHIELPPGASMISLPVTYRGEEGPLVAYGAQLGKSATGQPGAIMGFIHKLPSGAIDDSFRIGSPSPGMEFKEVMGAKDEPEDEELPTAGPEEKPIDDDKAIEQKQEEITEVEGEIEEIETQLRTEIDPNILDRLRARLAAARTEHEEAMAWLKDKMAEVAPLYKSDTPSLAMPTSTGMLPAPGSLGAPKNTLPSPVHDKPVA